MQLDLHILKYDKAIGGICLCLGKVLGSEVGAGILEGGRENPTLGCGYLMYIGLPFNCLIPF